MENIIQIFKALGDETRLKILIILSRKRICAKGLAKHLDISEAAVSQHIKVLKEAGIIIGEKMGYYVHYTVQQAVLLEAIHFIEEMPNKDHMKDCKWAIHMPKDCKVLCKASQNKCCKKN